MYLPLFRYRHSLSVWVNASLDVGEYVWGIYCCMHTSALRTGRRVCLTNSEIAAVSSSIDRLTEKTSSQDTLLARRGQAGLS